MIDESPAAAGLFLEAEQKPGRSRALARKKETVFAYFITANVAVPLPLIDPSLAVLVTL